MTSTSSTPVSVPTACAAASVNPPANTDSRPSSMRSGAGSRS